MENKTGKPARTGQTGRYLKYAFGEITLVVIGILIALSLNNWNENRKERIKERLVLTEISNSINSDLEFFENVLDYRLNLKSTGISALIIMIREKELKISTDSLMTLFSNAQTDISINYDSGPYDAVKAYGLEVISNDSLRKFIINQYEVLVPALKEFGDKQPELLNPLIEQLKLEIFYAKPVQEKSGVWNLKKMPKTDNILENADFINIIYFEERKYYNYLNRLNVVRKYMIKLNKSILKELDYLEKK